MIRDLKTRFSRSDRKHERVAALRGGRNRRYRDWHAAWSGCGRRIEGGALRKSDLETAFTQAGARRFRVVLQGEHLHRAEPAVIRLQSDDVRGARDTGDLFGDIVYVHLDRSRTLRSGAMVIRALVRYADQVLRAIFRSVQRKPALSVGLSPRHFLHSLGEFQQDDIVTRTRLVPGFIGDGSGDAGRKTQSREHPQQHPNTSESNQSTLHSSTLPKSRAPSRRFEPRSCARTLQETARQSMRTRTNSTARAARHCYPATLTCRGSPAHASSAGP